MRTNDEWMLLLINFNSYFYIDFVFDFSFFNHNWLLAMLLWIIFAQFKKKKKINV